MVRAAHERSLAFSAGCVVWVGLAVWLVWKDLGPLAFVGSILLGIWGFGLRDKFSNEETASAYSVFNQDQKGIAGGFTAGQLERQLRGIGGADETLRGAMATARVTKDRSTPQISNDEKLQRRTAAAAAAERRQQQQQPTY